MPSALPAALPAALLILLALLSAPHSAHGAEAAGVEMPDTWDVGQDTLVLNGLGVREYGPFGIDVYVAALYLPERESNADTILTGTMPKVLHMQYKRSGGSADKAREAWTTFLRKNCAAMDCAWPSAAVDQFLAMTGPADKAKPETFVFANGGVDYTVGTDRRGRVDSPVLARLLLASWIGPVPTTEDVRAGLLGEDR